MLLREIIAVYSEGHTNPKKYTVREMHELLKVKADGAYSKHCDLMRRTTEMSKISLFFNY
jgi:hypothetical protein